MDIGRLIRRRLRDALQQGDGGEARTTNVAISSNIAGSGHSTTVYSDGEVTIIERDGERQVIHHNADEAET
ncbi:MAG: hypothetical protein QOI95_449 [Acidimicrobiaceae bacterium]|jgi:hypothetical protein